MHAGGRNPTITASDYIECESNRKEQRLAPIFLSGYSPNNMCNSSNTTEFEVVRTFRYVVHIPTFILGLVVNSAALGMICFRLKNWTETVIYMTNLIFSDILLLFSLPFKMYAYKKKNTWHLGARFCQFVESLYFVNTYGTILLIMLISLDRYIAIKHPFKEFCRCWKFKQHTSKLLVNAAGQAASVGRGAVDVSGRDPSSGLTEGREKRKELKIVQREGPIKPGDQVYVRAFRRKWNEPRREEPFTVTKASPTTVQVEGRSTWYHLNHCTRAVPQVQSGVEPEYLTVRAATKCFPMLLEIAESSPVERETPMMYCYSLHDMQDVQEGNDNVTVDSKGS
ncbi:uncharacterized protein LOC134345377 isoform X2 [Mobula hypostoma]|uniref:uncharacterized protein LOC134345377 isoform X2 n=1 Tax=Mobula hypostoma TaxID=723540 RepID=UPI002FC38A3D